MKTSYKNLLYICKNLKLMRNLLAVLSIFLSVFLYSQASSNPFSHEEGHDKEIPAYGGNKTISNPIKAETAAADDDGPPNPGNPVPIDQYAGLLLITAIVIILYTTHKKRKLLTEI